MNVLYVTSEVAGYAKTGGLADVSAALPRYLAKAGHDVVLVMPYYGRIASPGSAGARSVAEGNAKSIDDAKATQTIVVPELDMSIGPHQVRVSIIRSERPGMHPVHLVRCPSLYARESLYTQDADEHLRFLVLVRAALELCQRIRFAPDVIHGNDWQCGLLPLTLKVRYAWDRQIFGRTKTLLAIHNLNYQGMFPTSVLAETGLADAANLFHQDQLRDGRINFLLHGLLYADGIVTVSPTYAKEIQGDEFGVGLDPFLRMRSSTVVGILNGVDYAEWSPEQDALIPYRFSPEDLSGKAQMKAALLDRFRLPYSDGVPVIGIVSRLAGQKGFGLFEDVMPALLQRYGFQLVILGSGEKRFEDLFTRLVRQFPRQVGFYQGFSNELAHWIEAGSDMFLMPSRYEPCGLNQMYSLKYGTVPIVHHTGGLADTVEHGKTGVVFAPFSAERMAHAIEIALAAYRDKAGWRKLVLAGMAKNFSWDNQTKLYEELYQRLLAL